MRLKQTRIAIALAVLAIGAAAPALASGESPGGPGSHATAVPPQLSDADRAAYRAVFAAIRSGNWTDASARLDAMPDGLLTPVARAIRATSGAKSTLGESLAR